MNLDPQLKLILGLAALLILVLAVSSPSTVIMPVISLISGGVRLAFGGVWLLLVGIGRGFALLLNLQRRGAGMAAPTVGGGGRGVLAPGDAAPPADRHADRQDYRGLASIDDLVGLRGAGLSLGRYLSPRGSLGPDLWLDPRLLERNCAVIGPPGSGKTEGVIIPWILQLLGQGASVVTVDVKGDLIDRVRGPASDLGARAWYWNSADQGRSLSWNPLSGITDTAGLEAACQSILGRQRPNDPQPFFYERDYRWLRALIQMTRDVHGAFAPPHLLFELVADQEVLRNLFRNNRSVQGQASQVADLLQFSPDEHSRAASGLLNALHLFNTPEVRAITETSSFGLEEVANIPTLLVVGASLAHARAGEVLSALILSQLLTTLYRRFRPGGLSGSRPTYFLLDEAARLKDRINLEEALSVARSAQVGFCLAAQDVAQFGDEREQQAILANCLTFVALRGCSPLTARFLAARLGERTQQQVNVQYNRGPYDIFSGYSRNVSSETSPVLQEREIMYPPVGQYPAVVQVLPVTPRPFLVELARR